MDDRATGYILRLRPLTETSLIVTWLTAEAGRLATVAKAARRPKSPFRGKLDLFYHADFSFARSRRSDLHTLREVALRDTCPALRSDFDRFEAAAQAARLLERATEPGTPLPEFYALFAGYRAFLAQHPVTPQHRLAFQAGLLAASGLQPDPQSTPLSPGSRQLLTQFLTLDWHFIARLKPTPDQHHELARCLDYSLRDHFGLPTPKSP